MKTPRTSTARRLVTGSAALVLLAAGLMLSPTTGLTVRAQIDHHWVATTTVTRGSAGEFRLAVPVSRGKHVICVFATNIGAGATGGLGCTEATAG